MLNTVSKLTTWFSGSLKKTLILISVLILILYFIVKALSFFTGQPAIPNKLVEVETVTLQPLQQTIRLLGTIHPTHTAVIMADGSGTLDAVIPTGQKVKKGTLIAKIDSPDSEKNLQLSISAEALAKDQFERLKPLVDKGYISAREFEEKKQAWLAAQKELSKTRMEAGSLHFYAPFDGIVGAYKKREGSQVNRGEPVVTMYDPSSIVVDFDIPCSNLTEINEGQPVVVLGKSYTLTHVQKMLDEESHMCPADVNIRCETCLIGATVPVDLVVAEKKEVLVVPFQAVFLRNSKPFVYVVEQGKIVLVAVKTGLKQKDKIEIVSGLKPGMSLVIKGQERLYPDMAVDIYQPKNITKNVSKS